MREQNINNGKCKCQEFKIQPITVLSGEVNHKIEMITLNKCGRRQDNTKFVC